jgi:hypothetical protein
VHPRRFIAPYQNFFDRIGDGRISAWRWCWFHSTLRPLVHFDGPPSGVARLSGPLRVLPHLVRDGFA